MKATTDTGISGNQTGMEVNEISKLGQIGTKVFFMSRKVFHLAANPFKPHFLLSMLFVMLLVGMAVVNDAQIRTLILIPALIIYVAVFLLMLFESQHLAKTIVQELQAQAGSAGTLVEQAKSLPKPVRAGA